MAKRNVLFRAFLIAVVAGIATDSQAQQQQRRAVGGPAPAAPSAPHMAPAPHIAVPHVAAPPIAAPHIAAPHPVMPQIAAPRVATPHVAGPPVGAAHVLHAAAPRLAARPNGFARSVGRPALHGPGLAATHAARTSNNNLPARVMTQRRIDRAQLRATSRAARSLASAGANISTVQANLRPGRSIAPQLRNRRFAAADFHGRVVDRDLDRRRFLQRFADRDRDLARRSFHSGFVGWVGPVFWPYAEYDVVDYALWPYDYGPLVYAYGADEIYDGIFWPYAADEQDRYVGSRAARRHAGGRYATPRHHTAATSFARICSGESASGIADWPIRQIDETVQPTAEQRPLLDELAAATAKAAETIKAACPRQTPSTPTGRLAVMESRLTAMRAAVDIVRPALAKFYQALDDEQKARFNAMGKPADGEDPSALARACAEQASGMPQWPTEQIVRTLRLTDVQRAKLDDVQAAAALAADRLKASCPTEIPATPPGRVDAIAQRLDALLQAVTSVRERLETFYAALSDEQKARFNTMGARASRHQS